MDDQASKSPKLHQGEERPVRYKWPELVGLTADEAVRRLREEKPNLQLQVVAPAHCFTMDYRMDRVRIFVDSEGKVERAPMIG